MPIVNRVADLQPDIQAWRRNIHEHPELLYDVHRTASFVADRLREFGCDEVVTGLGKTGVVGVIKGKKGAGTITREVNGIVIGAIAVRDELRPEAAEVVARLHADGYTVAMLTGDNEATARRIAVTYSLSVKTPVTIRSLASSPSWMKTKTSGTLRALASANASSYSPDHHAMRAS